MNECQITACEFFVSSRETPEVLEFAKPVFDLVPPSIKSARATRWRATVFLRRNHASHFVLGQTGPHRVSVVGPVGGQSPEPAGLLALSINFVEADQIVPFASGQRESDGGVFVRAGRMHLGRQSAARATKSLTSAVFFGAPAAWGCAGMLVLSTKTSSKAGVAPRESTSHNRFQTPALSQRRKRMYTAIQAPNSSGRSRQGRPVRVRYNTASTNSRSAKPGGAPRGSFTSMSAAASSSHIALVNSFRAIPTVYNIRCGSHRLFVNTP
jgi:hypothetical protein